MIGLIIMLVCCWGSAALFFGHRAVGRPPCDAHELLGGDADPGAMRFGYPKL